MVILIGFAVLDYCTRKIRGVGRGRRQIITTILILSCQCRAISARLIKFALSISLRVFFIL